MALASAKLFARGAVGVDGVGTRIPIGHGVPPWAAGSRLLTYAGRRCRRVHRCALWCVARYVRVLGLRGPDVRPPGAGERRAIASRMLSDGGGRSACSAPGARDAGAWCLVLPLASPTWSSLRTDSPVLGARAADEPRGRSPDAARGRSSRPDASGSGTSRPMRARRSSSISEVSRDREGPRRCGCGSGARGPRRGARRRIRQLFTASSTWPRQPSTTRCCRATSSRRCARPARTDQRPTLRTLDAEARANRREILRRTDRRWRAAPHERAPAARLSAERCGHRRVPAARRSRRARSQIRCHRALRIDGPRAHRRHAQRRQPVRGRRISRVSPRLIAVARLRR